VLLSAASHIAQAATSAPGSIDPVPATPPATTTPATPAPAAPAATPPAPPPRPPPPPPPPANPRRRPPRQRQRRPRLRPTQSRLRRRAKPRPRRLPPRSRRKNQSAATLVTAITAIPTAVRFSTRTRVSGGRSTGRATAITGTRGGTIMVRRSRSTCSAASGGLPAPTAQATIRPLRRCYLGNNSERDDA